MNLTPFFPLFKAVQLPALSELEAKALGMKEGPAPCR